MTIFMMSNSFFLGRLNIDGLRKKGWKCTAIVSEVPCVKVSRQSWRTSCRALVPLLLLTFVVPAQGQVIVQDNLPGQCTAFNDATTAISTVRNDSANTCGLHRGPTNTTNAFFHVRDPDTRTTADSLSLGGRLYVNEGNITVVDIRTGTYATRIGSNATAEATAGANAIAIGSAQTSTAAGAPTQASGASAIAIGAATTATSANAIAIGSGAQAGLAGSVALGAGSQTGVAAPTGAAFATQQAAPLSVVSVGSPAAPRRITNVSAGSAPTDAANVGQLSQIAQGVSTAIGGGQIFDPTTGVFTAPQFMVNDVTGASVTHNSVGGAVNALNTRSNSNATAISGLDTRVTGAESNITNLGTRVTGAESSITNIQTSITGGTLGLVQQATPDAQVTVAATRGGDSVNLAGTEGPRTLLGVAAGDVEQNSTHAVNGSQLFATNANVTTNTTAISGLDTRVTGAESNITNLGTRVTGTESNIANLQTSITNITEGTTGLVRQASDTGNLTVGADTDGRVVALQNSANETRTLTGLTAGDLSATSADALNGSQLFATNTNVTTNTNAINANTNAISGNTNAISGLDTRVTGTESNITNLQTSITNITEGTTGLVRQASDTGNLTVGADTDGRVVALQNSANETRTLTGLTAGDLSATSADAVNGSQLFATNTNVTTNTNAISANTNAISGNTNAISGLDTRVTGTESNISNLDTRIIGAESNIANIQTSITSITEGTTGLVRQASDTGNLTVGTDTNGRVVDFQNSEDLTRTLTGLTAGDLSATSADAVNGSQLHNTNINVSSLATRVDSIGDVTAGALTYDRKPDGDRANVVTLQGGDPNAPVIISNVGAGVVATDVVNKGQLDSGLGGVRAHADTQAIAAERRAADYTNQIANTTLSQANDYTDQRFAQLNQGVDVARSEARQAAAIGLAAASLRFDNTPGKISLAAGGGAWGGQGALAFGAGFTSDDGLVRANVTGTFAGGQVGVGGGISVTIN
jgi:autotransporter adhesin